MNSLTLSAELERLLAPQERFEQLRRETALRKGPRLCDLSYANPHDGPNRAGVQAIRDALETTRSLDLQYTPYGGSTITRRLVAQALSARCGCAFDWRHVVLTPGAMAALNVVFRAVRSTDGRADEVVVIAPCWMDYPLYLVHLGMRPVFVPVARDLRLDLGAIAAAIGPATRAVVLSQPANPTGIIYSREELDGLAAILHAQDDPPLLVSDECHRDIRAGAEPCPSPVECYDSTCVIYSFGKSLFMQGQRIGYAAVSPRMTDGLAFARLLERVCRMMGFCTPTALMQLAIRRLLGVVPDMSATLSRRERTVAALRSHGFDVVMPQATFFVYPRSPEPDDVAFVDRLAECGVLALPAAVFHHSGHFRLSLTAPDSILDAALDALGAVTTGALR